MTNTSNPRIYVACLAAYNAGRLHGVWIDADSDVSTMEAIAEEMIENSPAAFPEEYAIHDFENLPKDAADCLDTVADYMEAIEDHGEGFEAVANAMGVEAALYSFKEGAVSYAESAQDWAFEMLTASGDVPERLHNYLDTAAYIRDAECEGTCFVDAPDGVYIVHPC